jgi:protein gp37
MNEGNESMAENTKIEWCDATFNPWRGCTKVSPGCANCYAETLSTRNPKTLGMWGPNGTRVVAAESQWELPLKWNRQAEREVRRFRVFCASLADVFDNQAQPSVRFELWCLIADTPHLDWLLLTKRPQNIAKMLPQSSSLPAWGEGWPNVWLGTTVENQAEAERRIPHLLAVPAAKRFLSCEPLLEPVALHHIADRLGDASCHVHALTGARWYPGCGSVSSQTHAGPRIDWVIAGGESGPGARLMHPGWARSLRDQCAAAGVAFFMKQMSGTTKASMWPIPDDLMVRETPRQ